MKSFSLNMPLTRPACACILIKTLILTISISKISPSQVPTRTCVLLYLCMMHMGSFCGDRLSYFVNPSSNDVRRNSRPFSSPTRILNPTVHSAVMFRLVEVLSSKLKVLATVVNNRPPLVASTRTSLPSCSEKLVTDVNQSSC